MDLEASIIERLEKLRQWQIEQQERLLHQQKIQRDILTQKQDCVYKALEHSLQELDLNETEVDSYPGFAPKLKYNLEDSQGSLEEDIRKLAAIHSILKENGNLNGTLRNDLDDDKFLSSSTSLASQDQSPVKPHDSFKRTTDSGHESNNNPSDGATGGQNIDAVTEEDNKQIKEFLMEGVTPLPPEKPGTNPVSIDDVPIPSLKKDFQTLLEERLKDCEGTPVASPYNTPNVKIKRPFLKKGQGLSRFRLHQDAKPGVRPRSSSLNLQQSSKQSKGQDSKHKESTPNSKTSQNQKGSSANVRQQQLSLKNVPLPKKKFRSKSESSSAIQSANSSGQSQNTADLNGSDYQTKTQKELEEMRIFELLEEKAENSSFCSTSSAVVAFLQQSTPFKTKKKLNGVEANGISAKRSNSPLDRKVRDSSIVRRITQCTLSNGVQQQAKHTRKTSTECKDSYWESMPPVNQGKLQCPINDVDANVKCSRKSTGNKQQSPLRSYNQQSGYDQTSSVSANEVDVSLHVRFSEYNEYKTIGLTDTSSVSDESLLIGKFSDEKAWNDSFTPDTSDTETLPTKAEKPRLPNSEEQQQTVNHESRSVQCNVQDDLRSRDRSPERASSNYMYCKQKLQDLYSNEEDLESLDATEQYSDDEHSITIEYDKQTTSNNARGQSANCSNADGNCKVDESMNESLLDAGNGNTEERIFKSELLKTRLLELEREIDIFRKENAALSQQRKKLQEDQIRLRREYTEKEKSIEENQRQAELQLQEERRKLTREKTALEGRLRDAQEKAQQSRLERQEVHSLREEVERLKDELNLKESRWNAAQSRHKCQTRILKMENSKLKQELEKLQTSKRANNVKSKARPVAHTNTRAIHQINKQLNERNSEKKKKKIVESSSDSEEKMIEPMMEALQSQIDPRNDDCQPDRSNNKDADANKFNTSDQSKWAEQSAAKKRSLYQSLIKEATYDLEDPEDEPTTRTSTTLEPQDDDHEQPIMTEQEKMNKAKLENSYVSPGRDKEIGTKEISNDYTQFVQSPKIPEENRRESNPGKVTQSTMASENSVKTDKQGIRQVLHPDGRVEYWYPNGNVKKIFPDQGLTKMLYYNGDVRETEKDGKVKYFYASTHTWHTTMPDGLEVLEFADGQVEKRLHNGVIEISFPDDSVRILHPDGSEKWRLPDRTVIETFGNGEKILTLPNGQREIHTKDHKRREYPDGTVKLVYPDGSQETRYANGRVRLKDKDGNLLMDSYRK